MESTLKFKRSLEDDSEVIPTASMADITFLLIIFFMVGTVFNVDRGIEMRLPQSKVQQDISEENVVISVDAEKKIFIDGESTNLKGIGKSAADRILGHPERFVLLKSDRSVPYSIVIDILDELLQAGVTNIALPTEKEEP